MYIYRTFKAVTVLPLPITWKYVDSDTCQLRSTHCQHDASSGHETLEKCFTRTVTCVLTHLTRLVPLHTYLKSMCLRSMCLKSMCLNVTITVRELSHSVEESITYSLQATHVTVHSISVTLRPPLPLQCCQRWRLSNFEGGAGALLVHEATLRCIDAFTL